MTLGCDLVIGQISQTYAESMTFTNKISGAGGLTVSNGKAWLYHWQHLNLHVQHGAKMILSIAALLLLVAAPALPDTAMNAPRTVVAAAFRERGIYIALDLFTSRQAPTLPGADKHLVRSHATPPRHR